MANKSINVYAICPFFITESNKSITCEGIIGKENVSRFNTVEEKKAHEEYYCTKQDYEACEICKALLGKYRQEENKLGDITQKYNFSMP